MPKLNPPIFRTPLDGMECWVIKCIMQYAELFECFVSGFVRLLVLFSITMYILYFKVDKFQDQKMKKKKVVIFTLQSRHVRTVDNPAGAVACHSLCPWVLRYDY